MVWISCCTWPRTHSSSWSQTSLGWSVVSSIIFPMAVGTSFLVFAQQEGYSPPLLISTPIDGTSVEAVLRFEFFDLGDDIARDKDRIVPPGSAGLVRDDILHQSVDARPFILMLRPIRGKYLVGLSAQEEIARPGHLLVHDLAEAFVEVRYEPATIFEAAVGILLRPAWRLHDAIKRYECKYNDFSHGIYSPLNAFSNSAITSFFIGRNACVRRSICSRVPFAIISSIVVGTICHERPYLSLSQPHCSASGTAESLSQ